MTVNKLSLFILISSLLLSNQACAEIVRSAFSTGIENHEPIDRITQAKNDQVVYYFTDLRGLTGHTVLHLWDFNGKQYAVIPFEVKGERWRVYSFKTSPKNMTGNWLVTVFDQTSGKILGQNSLPVAPQINDESVDNINEQPTTTSVITSPTTPRETAEQWIVKPSSHEAAERPTANHFDSLNKDVLQKNTNQTKQDTPTPSNRLPIWEILPR